MAKQKTAADFKHLSPEERGDALLREEYGDVEEAEGLEDAAPVAAVDQSLLDFAEDNMVPDSPDSGGLVPDLLSVFPDAQKLSITMEKAQSIGAKLGIKNFMMEEPRSVYRVKKVEEPEDIYNGDDALKRQDHLKIIFYFLSPVLNEDHWEHLLKVSQCRGVFLGDLLRQELWHMVRERRFSLEGAPTDRKKEHDSDKHLDNRRLVELLQWSNFDVLQDKSRSFNCSPATAFQFCIKNGVESWSL